MVITQPNGAAMQNWPEAAMSTHSEVVASVQSVPMALSISPNSIQVHRVPNLNANIWRLTTQEERPMLGESMGLVALRTPGWLQKNHPADSANGSPAPRLRVTNRRKWQLEVDGTPITI